MTSFNYTFFAQEVVFRSHAFTEIDQILHPFPWKRMMLCTTKGFRNRGLVDVLENKLVDRLVAVYDNAEPHVPDDQVDEALRIAEESNIDAVIGLGGGSCIGLAKAVSFLFEKKRSPSSSSSYPTEQPLIPVIAIPTTYSGSEMTSVYGITHQKKGISKKVTVKDVKITPKLTIYDPVLTCDLPPSITSGTGINAAAHCVEALYSVTRNPMSTAAAMGGLRSISNSLLSCYQEGNNLEARTEMLHGAFLAGVALSNVKMGLHHGACHVLGGTANVSHGNANSIMLPHAMRFNLDETADQLALAGEAMGVKADQMTAEEVAEESIKKVTALISDLQLPSHLRDVGVEEERIGELAELAFRSGTVQNNPKKITKIEQMEDLFKEAW